MGEKSGARDKPAVDSMAAMAWQTTGDVTEFLAAAGPYLRRERARNTVILTVTEPMRVHAAASAGKSPGSPAPGGVGARRPRRRSRPPTGRCSAGGRTRPARSAGAFMHTPPFPLVLTAVDPEAAAELAAGRWRPGRSAG